MRTIKIEFEVTKAEYELLVAAKSEAPHPTRVRAMLVHDAARLLRRMGDDAIEALRQGQREAIREHNASAFADGEMSEPDELGIRRHVKVPK